MMTREEIKTILPHREPMLLVDDMRMEGEECISHYTVRGDEYFLQGHFPGFPVVPGVILCEIMGQSCSILIKDKLQGMTTLYTGLDKVRFKRQVRPGDTIEVRGRLTMQRSHNFVAEAEATVNGELAVKGTLSFALIENDKRQ